MASQAAQREGQRTIDRAVELSILACGAIGRFLRNPPGFEICTSRVLTFRTKPKSVMSLDGDRCNLAQLHLRLGQRPRSERQQIHEARIRESHVFSSPEVHFLCSAASRSPAEPLINSYSRRAIRITTNSICPRCRRKQSGIRTRAIHCPSAALDAPIPS